MNLPEYANKLDRIQNQIEKKYGDKVLCEIGDSPIQPINRIKGYITSILEEVNELKEGQHLILTFERIYDATKARLLFIQYIKRLRFDNLKITTRKEKMYIIKV